MTISNKELEAASLKFAKLTAKEYRDLAATLTSCANVLDQAGSLHSAFPTLDLSAFTMAAKMGAQLQLIRDGQLFRKKDTL